MPHTLRMRYGLLLALLKPRHRDARMCSKTGSEPRLCSKADTEPRRRARVSVQAQAASDASRNVASKASKARPSCTRSGDEYIRSAYVSIRQHIRQNTSEYVSIRQHTSKKIQKNCASCLLHARSWLCCVFPCSYRERQEFRFSCRQARV